MPSPASWPRRRRPSSVREAEPLGFDERVWAGLAEMGIPTMGVPENRQAAPVPPSPTWRWWPSRRRLPGARPHRRSHGGQPAGAPVAGQRWLPRRSPCSRCVPPSPDGLTLVPGGAVAHRSSPSTTTTSCWRLPVSARPNRCRTSARHRWPTSISAVPRHRTTLASGPEAHERYAAPSTNGAPSTSSWMVGPGTRRARHRRRSTSKDRKQFGVPIGSFQAVQHRLADLATALDGGGPAGRQGGVGARRRRTEAAADARRRWRSRSAARRPKRWPQQPALPRRLRLHGGVRHPALLPAGQGGAAGARRSRAANCSIWPTGCSVRWTEVTR